MASAQKNEKKRRWAFHDLAASPAPTTAIIHKLAVKDKTVRHLFFMLRGTLLVLQTKASYRKLSMGTRPHTRHRTDLSTALSKRGPKRKKTTR
jgi:hypothetical protein